MVEAQPSFQTPIVWLVVSDAQKVRISVERLAEPPGNVPELEFSMEVVTGGSHLPLMTKQLESLILSANGTTGGLDGVSCRVRVRDGEGRDLSLSKWVAQVPTSPGQGGENSTSGAF